MLSKHGWLQKVIYHLNVTKFAQEEVPDSFLARLNYYIFCVDFAVPGIEIGLADGEQTFVEKISDFANWAAYQEYDSMSSLQRMASILNFLNPKLFVERGLFIELSEEEILLFSQDTHSKFIDIDHLRSLPTDTSAVSRCIYINGQQYDAKNAMLHSSNWLETFYHEPMRMLKQKTRGLLSISPDVAPINKVATVNNGSFFQEFEGREPERDAFLWYAILSLLSAVILILLCVSFGESGFSADDSDGQRVSYSIWKKCRETLSGDSRHCFNYQDVSSFGTIPSSTQRLLVAARVLCLIYPLVGLVLLICCLLKFWDRKSRKNIGRSIRAMVALMHLGYVLTLCLVVNQYYSELNEELATTVDINPSNGMGIVLPWIAWIITMFHTLISCVWAMRYICSPNSEVAPI